MQPLQAGQVVLEDRPGIEVALVINDPARALIATFEHGPAHGQFVSALTESQELWCRTGVHSIEVETMEVALHQFEGGGPVPDVVVSVVPVVDDSNVCVPEFMEGLADGYQVGGFSAPPPVIVETELAPKARSFFCEWDQGCCRSGDIRGLGGPSRAGQAVPDLRVEIVFSEKAESL